MSALFVVFAGWCALTDATHTHNAYWLKSRLEHSQASNNGSSPVCPSEEEFAAVIARTGTHANHNHTSHAEWTWQSLYQLDPDYTTATIMLARSYGYDIKRFENDDNYQIHCGFNAANGTKVWTCLLDRDGAPKPTGLPRVKTRPVIHVRNVGREGRLAARIKAAKEAGQKQEAEAARQALVALGGTR